MRIALFSDTWSPTINGVARTLERLVEQAHRRGHEVAVVAAGRTSQPPARNGPQQGVVLHHTLPGVPFPPYPELLVARTLDAAGRRRLGAFAPEVVHVATEGPVGWSGRRWALGRNLPLVTSFHTDIPAYLGEYGMGLLEPVAWRYLRSFHRAAARSFCPSRATREALRAQGFHPRWAVWSRGVDTERFSPALRDESVRNDLAPGADHILVHVGRLAPEKRCEVAIRAYARLREDHPKAALVFIGDGPDRGRLEALAPAGVRFVGYRTGEALSRAFASADVVLFPSDTETFGNVALEALASGVPVVGADRGGIRDTVTPGLTGFLCRAGAPEDFAMATRRLLEDEPLRRRMAAEARAAALGRSWERACDPLFHAYLELGIPR